MRYPVPGSASSRNNNNGLNPTRYSLIMFCEEENLLAVAAPATQYLGLRLPPNRICSKKTRAKQNVGM